MSSENRPIRIALDAMGSDAAPAVELAGAILAGATGCQILLVGDAQLLETELRRFPPHDHIRIVRAAQRILMDEPPVQAVRRKKDASIVVAMRLLRAGDADAVVSAGNTGAVMVAARVILGNIQGVARSAICQVLPTRRGEVVLLDLGANVDCSARQLCEFAEMGAAYSQFALGVAAPRVGLLNIGEEDLKGSQVSRDVHQHLRAATHINFIGNVEPRAMFDGAADVVVCDGFVGNLMLKTSEAVAGLMTGLFERAAASLQEAAGIQQAVVALKSRVDPNEMMGGVLLGVRGIVVVHHGSCSATGICNALRGAHRAHGSCLVQHIQENIDELRRVEKSVTRAGGAIS